MLEPGRRIYQDADILKKTETHHKSVAVAVACFAGEGFSATSVREIFTRVGISQEAMCTYFKSKDELVKAVVLEEQNSALIAHNVIYAGSYFDRLCAQVTSYTSEIGCPITHQLWVEIMIESTRNPKLRRAYISSDDVMRKSFARLIQEGIAAGELRRDINFGEIMTVILAFVDGLITRQVIDTTFSFKDDLPMFFDVMAKLPR